MAPIRRSAADCRGRRTAAPDATDEAGPARPETGVDNRSRADGPPSPGSDQPVWFQLGVIAAAILTATVGSFGLLLAINDAFTTSRVLLVALPLTGLLVAGLWHRRDRAPVTRAAQVGAALALVIAVGYAAFAGATPSQHVVLNRDPAAYELQGRWIARSGSVDVAARDAAFEGIDGLAFRGVGLYNVPARALDAEGNVTEPTGDLQFQFNHLTSAVLAAAYGLGGQRLMFRAPAILGALGLLLVYAVAVRATRRPLLSLAAPLLLGACMPLLYVVRDTFSEPVALVLLWGGLLVLLDAHERPHPWVGVAGGVLLGSLAATRIDSLVYVVLLFPLAAVSIGAAKPGVRRARLLGWAVTIVTGGAVSIIGWVDLTRHSGGYADALSSDVTSLRQAVAASFVVCAAGLLAWIFVPALRRAARRIQRPVAWVAAGLVVLTLVGLWLVRTEVQVARPNATVMPTMRTVYGIQRAHGLLAEPRSYAEDSLWWMAWYLGIPALIAAIAGLGIAAWQTIRARATAATAAVGALTLGGGAVYWWNPSITPVQLWATRRFIPAVFPGLTVMAAVALATLVALPLVRRQASSVTWAASAGLIAVLVVPAAATTWPLRWQRAQADFLDPVLQTCNALEGNPAVVIVGSYESLTLQQTLRSWCGVPVAGRGSALAGADDARGLAMVLDARGYDLYLLAAGTKTVDQWAMQLGTTAGSSVGRWDRHSAEQTVDRAPHDYANPRRVLPLDGPFQLSWVRVPLTSS